MLIDKGGIGVCHLGAIGRLIVVVGQIVVVSHSVHLCNRCAVSCLVWGSSRQRQWAGELASESCY